MPAVRIIGPGDIAAAMRLKEAAGWNQTETDWQNLFRLAPDGCFGIDCDGTLVATTTAVCFGDDLAWIGMVLTHPDYRGRGLARQLMECALEYLERRGVAWIKLDATDMGRPLYRKLDFEDESAIERWVRQPAAAGRLDACRSGVIDLVLDQTAFGARRAELLDVLAPSGLAVVPGKGYAMGRPGTRAYYFGPCVSRTPEAARELLSGFLSADARQTVYWDLLPGNQAAVALARDFGFTPLRRLVRMVRPGTGARPFKHHDEYVYAIAGFEYG